MEDCHFHGIANETNKKNPPMPEQTWVRATSHRGGSSPLRAASHWHKSQNTKPAAAKPAAVVNNGVSRRRKLAQTPIKTKTSPNTMAEGMPRSGRLLKPQKRSVYVAQSPQLTREIARQLFEKPRLLSAGMSPEPLIQLQCQAAACRHLVRLLLVGVGEPVELIASAVLNPV